MSGPIEFLFDLYERRTLKAAELTIAFQDEADWQRLFDVAISGSLVRMSARDPNQYMIVRRRTNRRRKHIRFWVKQV